jgi:hypothetical protein
MAFDIKVKTQTFSGNEDRRWLGTRLGADQCRSITLDVSTFLAAHLAAKGAIPSGTVLGIITATGLYGPYDDAAVDGRAVARGFLFNTTKVGDGTWLDLATAADVGVPMFWGPGIIKEAFLPLFAGTVLGELDANARTDLVHFIRFEA